MLWFFSFYAPFGPLISKQQRGSHPKTIQPSIGGKEYCSKFHKIWFCKLKLLCKQKVSTDDDDTTTWSYQYTTEKFLQSHKYLRTITEDAKWWRKLTGPKARWAKMVPCCQYIPFLYKYNHHSFDNVMLTIYP